MVGGMLTQNVADIDPDSKIAEDRRGASGPIVRSIVSGPDTYGVLQLETALLYDSRDDEIAPVRGVFHEFAIRSAPGGSGGALPYNYVGFNVTTRFHVPLSEKRLSLALRLLGDALAGHVPLNELARFETMAATRSSFASTPPGLPKHTRSARTSRPATSSERRRSCDPRPRSCSLKSPRNRRRSETQTLRRAARAHQHRPERDG